MGILVDPHIIVSNPSLLLVIVAMVVVGKFVIWAVVVKLFGYPTKTALMVGLGLTQIGEFSYVLVRVARDAHIVGDDMYNAVLAASVVTILINGLLLRFVPGRLAAAKPEVE
jgi:CPA2 family monovalent cation:H+ antiporter-2